MIARSREVLPVLAAAIVLAACTPTRSAPSVDALLALERQASEAYFQGDGKFFEGMLSDKLVMQRGGSRLDKAYVVRMISGARCDVVAGWSLTEPQISKIDNDTYALSYVSTVDGSCTASGRTERLPSPVRASTVWTRNGEQWQVAFHGENLIGGPVAAAGADEIATPPAGTASDPLTVALMAAETAVWEAWRTHDGERIAALTSEDMSFVNIFGACFPDKPASIKDWTSTACNVTRVALTRGAATSLSPTVGILTVTGTVEGACGDQDISGQEIYATTVYVKDGEEWKWAFGFNSPR